MINRRDIMSAAAVVGSSSMMPAVAQEQTPAVVDAIGMHVLVKHPVERVVIASHYAYEDFTAIAGVEGWSKVVGFAREPWQDWRAGAYAEYEKVIPNLAAIPDVGILGSDFDVAKVIALKPDVVLLEAFSDSLIGEDVRALQAAGIPIVRFNFQSETLFKHVVSAAALGQVMGTTDRAGALIKLYESLHKDAMARVPNDVPFTQSVYAEIAETGPDVVGWTDSHRLWGGMALQLNALNIAQDKVPDYGGPLPQADLISADPDIILFAGDFRPPYSKGLRTGYGVDAATTHTGLRDYAARSGYDQLKAVRSGAVHAVDHSLVWSLRDVYALQYVAKQLYPSAYKDVDPVKGLSDFHARFLPVPFSGTWFLRLGE